MCSSDLASSPNDDQDKTGFINRIFKYGYAVHAYGRELKQRNRKVYYLAKWLMFAIIIGLILLPSFL